MRTSRSQGRPQLPQQREEPQVATAAQIGRAGRTTGARLVADLPFHDGRVQCPPLRRQLVVGEQPLRDVPEIAVRRTVVRDRQPATRARRPRCRPAVRARRASRAGRPTASARRAGAAAGLAPRRSPRAAAARTPGPSGRTGTPSRGTAPTGSPTPVPAANGSRGSPAASSSRAPAAARSAPARPARPGAAGDARSTSPRSSRRRSAAGRGQLVSSCSSSLNHSS